MGTIDFIKADVRHEGIIPLEIGLYLDDYHLVNIDFLKKLLAIRKKLLTSRLDNEHVFNFIKKLKNYENIPIKEIEAIKNIKDLEAFLTKYNCWSIFCFLLKVESGLLFEKELPFATVEAFSTSFKDTIKNASTFESPLLKELTTQLEDDLNNYINPFLKELSNYDSSLNYIDLFFHYIENKSSLSLSEHIFLKIYAGGAMLQTDIGFINHLYNALPTYDVIIPITGKLHCKNIKEALKEKKFTNHVNDESEFDLLNLIPIEPDTLKKYFKSVLE